MIPPRPQANDNHNPADACELQMDEVKRRFVARIACAARGSPSPGARFAPVPDRHVSDPSRDL